MGNKVLPFGKAGRILSGALGFRVRKCFGFKTAAGDGPLNMRVQRKVTKLFVNGVEKWSLIYVKNQKKYSECQWFFTFGIPFCGFCADFLCRGLAMVSLCRCKRCFGGMYVGGLDAWRLVCRLEDSRAAL